MSDLLMKLIETHALSADQNNYLVQHVPIIFPVAPNDNFMCSKMIQRISRKLAFNIYIIVFCMIIYYIEQTFRKLIMQNAKLQTICVFLALSAFYV